MQYPALPFAKARRNAVCAWATSEWVNEQKMASAMIFARMNLYIVLPFPRLAGV